MKALAPIVALLVLVAVESPDAQTVDEPAITIDRIDADQEVSGHVAGLQPLSSYKVVLYVKTDRWYIHPYATGGVGRSYAEIANDGSWSIPTVDRGFSAKRLAALVVRRDAEVPSQTEAIASVRSAVRVVRELTGTDDFGKL